jgi:hypothetical protein
MQRFWLTATAQGLQLQPEMTPLIFSRYVREGRVFSATPGMQERGRTVAPGRGAGRPAGLGAAVFMGRIGAGERLRTRSLRRPLRLAGGAGSP